MDVNNQYGLLETHKDLLSLMSIFDKLCLDNEIVYSADSGTLLGAVRHKGFIPWDDDLDVVVNRENYNKLMKLDLGKYGLQKVRKTFIESLVFKDNYTISTKPIIDIFVIDNTPDWALFRNIKRLKIMMIHGLWHHYYPQKYKNQSIIKKIYSFVFGLLGRFYSEEEIFFLFQKVCKEGNDSKTRSVQCFNYLTKELNVCYPSNILNEIVRHPFESIEINIPKMYDIYLKNLYGDYMIPSNSNK